MKQKLMMILAVLLTGGMLVACGPGDGGEEVGGGGGVDSGAGVVGEPLGGDGDAIGGDVAVGDEGVAAEEDVAAADAALDDAAAQEGGAEGEEIQLDVEQDAEVPVEGGADQPAAEGEQPAEEPAAEQPAGGEEVAGGGAAPAQGEPVVITFTQAAEGVAVENIEGAQNAEQIAETGTPNPDLTLSTGQRYEFSYDGEGDLVFYNANDEELLSTAGTETTFSQDSEVQAETGSGQLTFTLTDQLAQEIDHYTVGPDQQGGQVNVN